MRKVSAKIIYRQRIIDELSKTQISMDCIYSKFDNVIDPDLIDSCIYELNASQKKYRYLINLLRDFDITETSSTDIQPQKTLLHLRCSS